MKHSILVSFVALAACGGAAADLPRKAPLTKYRTLWTDSPFTTKPIVDGGPPPPNPLDDYALAGVSPIEGGYRVTIMNKKDPTERHFVYSDEPDAKHGFRILSVDRKDGEPRSTVVRMKSGSLEGEVSYDEKLLTLAQAPAPQQQVQKPGQPPQPGAQPVPVPNPNAPGVRAPRPRVIGPPPVNTQNPTTPGPKPTVTAAPTPVPPRPVRSR